MSAPDTTVVQVNLKTPAGTLINFYAENVTECKEIIEAAIEDLANSVAAAEQAFGASSNVASAAPVAARQPSGAPTPTAEPAGDGPLCDHGEPMKFIPPGISKAGKPYKGFYACARQRSEQCDKKVSS